MEQSRRPTRNRYASHICLAHNDGRCLFGSISSTTCQTIQDPPHITIEYIYVYFYVHLCSFCYVICLSRELGWESILLLTERSRYKMCEAASKINAKSQDCHNKPRIKYPVNGRGGSLCFQYNASKHNRVVLSQILVVFAVFVGRRHVVACWLVHTHRFTHWFARA